MSNYSDDDYLRLLARYNRAERQLAAARKQRAGRMTDLDVLKVLDRILRTRTAWIYAESAAEIRRLRARVAELEAQLEKRKR